MPLSTAKIQENIRLVVEGYFCLLVLFPKRINYCMQLGDT